MRKTLLLLSAVLCLPLAMRAQTPTDDTFTVSDIFYDDYFKCYAFNVGLNAQKIYTAYNLDLVLPTGITVKTESDKNKVEMPEDDSIYPSTSGRTGKTYTHTINTESHAGNILRVACASIGNENFQKTSGPLFEVCIDIDESAFTSSFSAKPIVQLSGLNLTAVEEGAAVKYVPADFACRPFTTGIPTARTLAVNVSAENKIGTLILPFDATLPSGLKAYTCSAAEGDLLTLTPAESIAACTPYIVYAESGFSGSLSGTASLSDDSNVTDVFAGGYLTGVLTGTSVSTGYILQNQGGGPLFYDADGANLMLPAGRCYLTPSGDTSVKSFRFSFNNTNLTPTLSLGEGEPAALYDLSGRRVLAPARGIYIKGMHKVVIK